MGIGLLQRRTGLGPLCRAIGLFAGLLLCDRLEAAVASQAARNADQEESAEQSAAPQESVRSLPGAERVPGLAPGLADLRATSAAFRSAAERVQPALVTIESFGGVSAVPGVIGGIRRQGEGNTTGLMLTADGWIVTSTFNFVQRPNAITVVTSDGQRRLARLAGEDNTRRICLLKIDGVEGLPVAEPVPAGEIRVGQWCLAVGVGFGDTLPSVSAGMISAVKRMGGRAIQADAKTSPACYGGPLIDLQGRVFGVCVPMSPDSWAASAGVEWYDSGIGFAVPLAGNEEVLERLKRGESIDPAFLGVSVGDSPAGGVLVSAVVPESAAAKAGLAAGVRILQLDGIAMTSPADLRRAVSACEAGATVRLILQDAGADQPRELELVLDVAPEIADQRKRPPGL